MRKMQSVHFSEHVLHNAHVMFVPARAAQALEQKREVFHLAVSRSADLRGQYETALDRLRSLSSPEISDLLGGVPWPGARPSAELDRRGLIVPFGHTWDSAQDARAWALKRLRNVPTAAVDGSQVGASKEFAVPLSLVQVAWFQNEHDPDRPYIKDVRNEVLLPEGTEIDQVSFAESELSRRRFALEMAVAVERIDALAERVRDDPSRTPLLFIDGTFVLSFAGRMAPEVRDVYLRSLFDLLEASERRRVPVIGYVDLSFASDVMSMLRSAFELPDGNVFDAQVLAGAMQPFDRTCAFQCARGDVLRYYRTEERDVSEDLYFVYLKIGTETLPARIDVPRWVVDADLLNHVIDVVRAEIVVGSGYPYPLETADAAAVLTGEDRIAFFRLFHQFAEEAGLTHSLPAKSVSKARRR